MQTFGIKKNVEIGNDGDGDFKGAIDSASISYSSRATHSGEMDVQAKFPSQRFVNGLVHSAVAVRLQDDHGLSKYTVQYRLRADCRTSKDFSKNGGRHEMSREGRTLPRESYDLDVWCSLNDSTQHMTTVSCNECCSIR